MAGRPADGRRRFVHTADWQLGMTRHFLGPDAQARFAAARLEAVRALGRLADAQGCDFVVVCGDVFESNHVDRQVALRALEALRDVPVPVYLLPGNHDPVDAGSILTSALLGRHLPGSVHVVATHDPVEAAPATWLHPAPWSSKHPLEDPTAAAVATLDRADGALHVVVGHGMVDRLSPDPANPALVSLEDLERAIESGAASYVALGDRHSRCSVGSTGRVWYSGAPEATDFDEVDSGSVLVVELDVDDPGYCHVTPHRVGSWAFVREREHVASSDDVESLRRRLDAMPDKDRTVVKLALEGTLSLRDKAALDEILDHYSELFAALLSWERRSDLAVMPDDEDFSAMSLSGYAAGALAELRERAAAVSAASEDRVTAQDALALLYRLARGGG